MRTASICPTCATFENALCVLYNGVYLTNTKISPLDSLETALVKINANLVPLSGAAAPAVNATYLGQQYLNTTTKQFYYARSVGSGAADWTLAVNGTVGQIGFYSSQYNVIGDNGLFWDNTAKRLGLGTVTPLAKLHVLGGSTTTSIANVATTLTSRFDLANSAISLGVGYVNTDIPMIQSFNNGTNIQTNLTINPFGGNVAIGKTTATKILDVAGDILVNDILIGKGLGQLNSNTLVGQTSLVNNTTGYQNTVLGFTSMQANTVGYQNTAVGAYSLTANVGGHENVAVGDYALTANTSGYDNVGIGARAATSSTTGYRNVAIGKEAMLLSVAASQSVAIGYEALINGASDSVAVGFKAGYDGGSGIVAVGFESLAINVGSSNTGVGYRSLYSNGAGTLNTGLGYYALRGNTIGVRNTAVGGQALYGNTDGNYNIAVGYDAGRYVTVDGGAANTSSVSSIYIGYKTLSATAADTNAIVIGNGALSLGSNTTVIGNGSTLRTVVRGNVLIGTTTSFTSNTAKLEVVGGKAYFETSEDSNAFVIYNGPNAETAIRYDSDSKYLFLQEDTGPVVVGASTISGEAYNLQVTGGIQTDNIYCSSQILVGPYGPADDTITAIGLGYINFTNGLTDTQGYYSINSITLSNAGDPVFNVISNGNVTNLNGVYGTISDRKLKENITPATSKLDDILKVNVVNYNLINDKDKVKQIGVVAQELEEIFPGLVSTDDEDIKSVKISVFIPMLIKGMQEQQDIIKNLQTQIDELKSKI